MSIAADIQLPAPGELVELYEIDATSIGGDQYFWVPSLNKLKLAIVFGGQVYEPFPIEAKGFDRNGRGTLPQPKVQVANITGEISEICYALDDLIGARFTRRRTFGKYLDAENFPGGVNPTADPNSQLPPDVFFVIRKSLDKPPLIEFVLGSASDLAGVMLPGRPVIANVCGWLAKGGYRGPYCGYVGPAVANANDEPTSDMDQDRCGGRLASCQLRQWPDGRLRFGGFPGVGLI